MDQLKGPYKIWSGVQGFFADLVMKALQIKIKNQPSLQFTVGTKWVYSRLSVPMATVTTVSWARTFKCLWGPGIDSKEWIPPAYVAWRAGTITLFLLGS